MSASKIEEVVLLYLQIEKDPNASLFLFTTCQKYEDTKDSRVHTITVNEIMCFIEKYRFLLPQRTRESLDVFHRMEKEKGTR